jgi:hypothetical protein
VIKIFHPASGVAALKITGGAGIVKICRGQQAEVVYLQAGLVEFRQSADMSDISNEPLCAVPEETIETAAGARYYQSMPGSFSYNIQLGHKSPFIRKPDGRYYRVRNAASQTFFRLFKKSICADVSCEKVSKIFRKN